VKITSVRVREVSIPRIYETHAADPKRLQVNDDYGRSRYQILELLADNGSVGLGEISDVDDRMQPLPAAEVAELLSEVVVGSDLSRWRSTYRAVARTLPEGLHPELRGLTLFGIEIALLDLVAKRYGAPLYELLGGRVREQVEVCWVEYLRGDVPLDVELTALEAGVRERLEQGFRAFKFKVGEDHERDLARIARFRQITGPGIYLRVDASGAWTEDEAIARITEMAELGIDACETPAEAVSRPIANDHPERINADPDGAARSLPRVRAAVRVPIIEHVADLSDAFSAALIRHQAVDVVNVIPSQGGGLLRGQQLIHTAETAGTAALLGSTVELGPGTAAMVHLALATANVSVSSDLVGPGLLVDDICRQPFRYRDGGLVPFDRPGLGVDLDEAKMNAWQV
jgi:muconate cycloisomerase